jgi:lipoprotein-anchoring transpeptidase ErfK/SrfK
MVRRSRTFISALVAGIALAVAVPAVVATTNAQQAAVADTTMPARLPTMRLAVSRDSRSLTVVLDDSTTRVFSVAVGSPSYPTPRGTYSIRKIVWNPSWVPPDSKWAKNKTAKGPGEPGNPMKVAKIFFKEPDYYIHGTGEINSLGDAASHGCIRMDPNDVAELSKLLMEHGGQPREESWFSRVIHLRWKTHTITLTQPVALTIGD